MASAKHLALTTPNSTVIASEFEWKRITHHRTLINTPDLINGKCGFFSIYSDENWKSVYVTQINNAWMLTYRGRSRDDSSELPQIIKIEISSELGNLLYSFFSKKITLTTNKGTQLSGIVDKAYVEIWVRFENGASASAIEDMEKASPSVLVCDKLLFIVNAQSEAVKQEHINGLESQLKLILQPSRKQIEETFEQETRMGSAK